MAPRTLVLSMILCAAAAAPATAQYSDTELHAAVSPLPSDLQIGAGIYFEVTDGEFEQIRKSKNGMSCARLIAERDDGSPVFDVRCYSDLLWPAIFHRWSIDGEFETYQEVYGEMHRHIEAGRVSLPETPTAGYRILGLASDFDMESGQPGPRMNKWQSIHFPFRTAEELGLTELEEDSRPDEPGMMPYVMASGSWWSHVMIVHR